MIEDDDGPAGGWFFSSGNSHQREDLQSFRKIGNIIALVIYTRIKDGFNDDVTAGIFAGAHGADLQRIRNRCGSWNGGGSLCGREGWSWREGLGRQGSG